MMMRRLFLPGLLICQVTAPVQAQTGWTTQRASAFGGLRLSVPLGGPIEGRDARAGLALAPALYGEAGYGEVRSRIGGGIELGYREGSPNVTVGGRDIRRIGAQESDERDEDRGLPTWVWIAGGVIVATGVGALVFTGMMNDASD